MLAVGAADPERELPGLAALGLVVEDPEQEFGAVEVVVAGLLQTQLAVSRMPGPGRSNSSPDASGTTCPFSRFHRDMFFQTLSFARILDRSRASDLASSP
ncbi:hypothetical protein OV079_39925 [Nannocystis pusilla]|uniref:Uncharacterized protein n=1 Tax=Nannocystis pusilla TaxID=889268 RepID=A0A9X3F4V6_9BACT|nr:hypothetical protein [Nannocystis pusilla]MCY1011628.1 hypothetical protein [Nannocystis pusilla]